VVRNDRPWKLGLNDILVNNAELEARVRSMNFRRGGELANGEVSLSPLSPCASNAAWHEEAVLGRIINLHERGLNGNPPIAGLCCGQSWPVGTHSGHRA